MPGFFKRSFLILLCFFTCSSLSGRQDSTKFYFGLKIGGGVGFLGSVAPYKNAGFKNNSSGTAILGFYSVYKFNKFLSIGAEVLYNFRGGGVSKVNDSITVYVNVYYSNGTPGPNNGPPRYYQNHKIGSLDIPCYLKIGSYNHKFSPFVNLGLISSFTMDYALDYNNFSGNRNYDHTTDLKGQSNVYSGGYLAGVGFKFKRLAVEFRYSYFSRTDLIVNGNKIRSTNRLFHLSLELYILKH